MKTIKLHRYWQNENQTLSTAVVLDDLNQPLFSSIMLERGWRNNETGVSCVPAGVYTIIYEWSPRFQMNLWELKGVPNRSECKFHASNYWYELNGCLAPGRQPTDLNKDGYLDVTASRNTLKAFHNALKGEREARLWITTEQGIR